MDISLIDVFRDESDQWMIFINGDSDITFSIPIECDVRERLCFEISLLDTPLVTTDIRGIIEILGDHDPVVNRFIDLRSFVAPHLLTKEDRTLREMLGRHRQTMKVADIDPYQFSVIRSMTPSLLRSVLERRAKYLMDLVGKLPESILSDDRAEFLRCLYWMERNGIAMDVPKAESLMKSESPESDLISGMRSAQRYGFLHTNFNPYIGKTGRIKTSGGFSCMNIPHGDPRSLIVSRFPDGMIASLDFNAIDYRCIVGSMVDEPEFVAQYADCDDFHVRSAAILMGKSDSEICKEHRRLVKESAYVSIYGGTADTLSQKLGVPAERLGKFIALLNEVFAPVHRFRDKLYDQYKLTGNVVLPNGRVMPVSPGAHPGMVMGIYAQSYSSWVFERSLVAVQKLIQGNFVSLPIFPVHDELNIDVHPDEVDRMVLVKECMEQCLRPSPLGLKVNLKIGKDYQSATE